MRHTSPCLSPFVLIRTDSNLDWPFWPSLTLASRRQEAVLIGLLFLMAAWEAK